MDPKTRNGLQLDTPSGWPMPPRPEALRGLAGEVVGAAEPRTEADPAALLITYLVAIGSAVGRSACVVVGGEARHGTNLFAALVGPSAKGRKGTSLAPVLRIMQGADPEWTNERTMSGLSSGEGLIWAIRDPSNLVLPGTKEPDPGVLDKRMFVIESEFAAVLQAAGRQGNTLSPLMRLAWDGYPLQTMTKTVPVRATDPHVSIIAHITRDELTRRLDETDVLNGFANRFLWCCVRRTKLLPRGGRIPTNVLHELGQKSQEVLAFARTAGELDFDDAGGERWDETYAELAMDQPGAFGAVTARAEPQVLRLSMVYALLDRSPMIRAEHIDAALAVWDYCEDSAAYLFGQTTGDRIADRITRELRRKPVLTRTEINDLFGGNTNGHEIDRARDVLVSCGRIVVDRVQTVGRPRETWRLE